MSEYRISNLKSLISLQPGQIKLVILHWNACSSNSAKGLTPSGGCSVAAALGQNFLPRRLEKTTHSRGPSHENENHACRLYGHP